MAEPPVMSDIHGYLGSVGAGLTLVSTFAGWLPPLAALIAVVWYIIQIAESDTMRGWRQRRRFQRFAVLRGRIEAMKKELRTLDGDAYVALVAELHKLDDTLVEQVVHEKKYNALDKAEKAVKSSPSD